MFARVPHLICQIQQRTQVIWYAATAAAGTETWKYDRFWSQVYLHGAGSGSTRMNNTSEGPAKIALRVVSLEPPRHVYAYIRNIPLEVSSSGPGLIKPISYYSP